MARINIDQLRNWQNGDIIPASDYNQERNLIITAQNDTNTKANEATLDASNALRIVEVLNQVGLPITEGSAIRSTTIRPQDGQTVIDLDTPYLQNANRIQVFVNGILSPVNETSPTSVSLLRPLQAVDTVTVRWFTEAPNLLDVQRIEDAIQSVYADFLPPIDNEVDLPKVVEGSKMIAVRDSGRIYRRQGGQWVYAFDMPRYIGSGLSSRKTEVHYATSGQSIFTLEKAYIRGQHKVDVYLSGVRQRIGIDVFEESIRSVRTSVPLTEGDVLEVVYYTTDISVAEDYDQRVIDIEARIVETDEIIEDLRDTLGATMDVREIDGGMFGESDNLILINGGMF